MSTVVHFSPELAAWLVQSLDQAVAPAALVQTMINERMDPRVARAIVDAFVLARQNRGPLPVDCVLLEEPTLEFSYDPPRVPARARFDVEGRVVRVLAHYERPPLLVLADVLDAEECAELIELSRPRLTPSTFVDPGSGRDVVSEERTSFGMFFRLGENALVARLDRRISALMQLPLENGEGFQVLRYLPGAQASPHFDFLQPSNAANRASLARSGQRVSTLIAYLNDVESGGETVFPKIGLGVLPQRGNAVYFEYCNGRSQVDEQSLHAGSPVLAGEKWVLTKWMRERRFVSAGAAAAEGMFR